MRSLFDPVPLKSLALVLVVTAIWAGGGRAEDDGLEFVEYKGKDYITTESLKNYFRFQSYEIRKGHLFYKSRDLVVKARHRSKDLYVNNARYVLSFPIVASDGKYLISEMDFSKLVDPILRPRYIRQSLPFQTVILDAGHGGKDSGTKGGVYGNEKTHALRLTKMVKAELERRGFRVKMTRTGDQDISLQQRVAYANKISNAIFVSLHFNDGHRSARGIETYALSPQGAESTLEGPRPTDNARHRGNDQDSANIALATAIHAAVMHEIKGIDRGIKRARWGVLTGIEKPGVLFEGGFLTNSSDAKQIASHVHIAKMANAIADGIVNYRNAVRR